ncbi:hypothetical protein ACVWXO_008633 [Bradyrhizobium sp. LM2.7]
MLPWLPVAFGCGIALYFAADHEPVLWVAAVTAAAMTTGAILLRRSRLFGPAIMIAAVAAGFAVATWKAARIAHTVLAKPLYSVSLSGFVETRDIRERAREAQASRGACKRQDYCLRAHPASRLSWTKTTSSISLLRSPLTPSCTTLWTQSARTTR